MDVEVAFSSSTLAAPMVTPMAMQRGLNEAKVLSSMMIGGRCHVAAELTLTPQSHLVGKRVTEIEEAHALKVLSRANGSATQSPPPADAMIAAGDRLIIHAAAARLAELSV